MELHRLPRFKVWQVATIGVGLIVLGLTLELAVDWGLPGTVRVSYDGTLVRRTTPTKELMHKLKWWMTFPMGVGVFMLYAAGATYRKQRADEAAEAAETAAAEPAKREPKPAAPLRSPPRLGDDPFREPPRVQIVVQRPVAPATPIVPGDPSDQPKLLK